MSSATLESPPQPGKWRRKGAPEFHPGKISPPPVFVWPWRLRAFLEFLFGFPGYLWPWNGLYLAIALATWTWATPSFESMKVFAAGGSAPSSRAIMR